MHVPLGWCSCQLLAVERMCLLHNIGASLSRVTKGDSSFKLASMMLARVPFFTTGKIYQQSQLTIMSYATLCIIGVLLTMRTTNIAASIVYMSRSVLKVLYFLRHFLSSVEGIPLGDSISLKK